MRAFWRIGDFFCEGGMCGGIGQKGNLRRNTNFLQAIHIFFSSEKNVNLKREVFLLLESDFVLFPRAFFPS